MHPAVFLALLTIALLALAALRLELDFRRAAAPGAGREAGGPGRKEGRSRPELRASPAGGYCQSPWSQPAARRG